MKVDGLSLTTTPVYLLRGGERVYGGKVPIRGSGFLVGHMGSTGPFVTLATCAHCITGSAPWRGRPPIGNGVEIQVRRQGEDVSKIQTLKVPTQTPDGRRLWMGSELTPLADVAVLQIDLTKVQFDAPVPAFDIAGDQFDIDPYPGQSVSVIGYPFGIRDVSNGLPVWKTGHIASEPEVDFENQPKFLIDITGRPGMSGSPVIAGHKEFAIMKSGVPRFGASGRVLGIYSSNATGFSGDDKIEESLSLEEQVEAGALGPGLLPEIGVVWKSSVIAEILAKLDALRLADRSGRGDR